MTRLRTILLCCTFVAAPISAQIPDGHVVVASVQDPSSPYLGPGGLYVAHPRTPGTFDPIGNLPAGLTGVGFPGQVAGARSILLLPDGSLLVGNRMPMGQPVEIHRLQIAGLGVVGSATITLGAALAGGGGVAQMALLSPTRVLAVGTGVAGMPTFAFPDLYVVEVDLTNGVVTAPLCWSYPTPLPMNLAVRGVAFDPSGQTAYFAVHHNTGPNTPFTTEVWSFTPNTRCLPTRVLTLQGQVNNLAWSTAGHLYIALSVGNSLNPALYRHTPATNSTTAIASGWDFFSACSVEPTTGALQLTGNSVAGHAQTGGLHWLGAGMPRPIQLANLLHGGGPRGALVGVAAASAPVTYGAPSGATHSFSWSMGQHQDRLPLRGNAAFFVDVAWPAGVTPAAAVGILDNRAHIPPLRVPFLGIDLHALPTVSGLMPLDPNGRRSVLAVPLPATFTPGAQVFVQAIHLDGGNWHASEGLRVRIL
jgi:hypothetical protein